MCRWKLGSMVRISGLFHLPIKWDIPWGYNPLILTFDPHFQRHIQVPVSIRISRPPLTSIPIDSIPKRKMDEKPRTWKNTSKTKVFWICFFGGSKYPSKKTNGTESQRTPFSKLKSRARAIRYPGLRVRGPCGPNLEISWKIPNLQEVSSRMFVTASNILTHIIHVCTYIYLHENHKNLPFMWMFPKIVVPPTHPF